MNTVNYTNFFCYFPANTMGSQYGVLFSPTENFSHITWRYFYLFSFIIRTHVEFSHIFSLEDLGEQGTKCWDIKLPAIERQTQHPVTRFPVREAMLLMRFS